MIVTKSTQPIQGWKPKMKNLQHLTDLPLEDTVLSAKADGEFTVFHFQEEASYIINRYGTLRQDFPALDEATEILQALGHTSTVLKAEFYAVDESLRPFPAWTFNHIAKGKGTDHRQLRLGYFDIIALEMKGVDMRYSDRLDLLSTWFEGAEYNHVLPYIVPTSHRQMERFWKDQVLTDGFEGIIANVGSTTRAPGQFYKMKTEQDIDVVILGINKKPLFKENKVSSLRVGVLDDDGDYIVIGDVTVPGKKGKRPGEEPLRSFLWRLMEYKVSEDDKTVWIRPFLVIAVKFQQPIDAVKDKLRFEDGEYTRTAQRTYYSLRHPRLDRFRGDKKAILEDVPASQL